MWITCGYVQMHNLQEISSSNEPTKPLRSIMEVNQTPTGQERRMFDDFEIGPQSDEYIPYTIWDELYDELYDSPFFFDDNEEEEE